MRAYKHSYQLHAKHRQIMNERRQDENYKTADDITKEYFKTVGQFYRHSEGDTMSKYEAQDRFEKGKKLIFSNDDIISAINILECKYVAYEKESKTHKVISETNKPLNIKVDRLGNSGFIQFYNV